MIEKDETGGLKSVKRNQPQTHRSLMKSLVRISLQPNLHINQTLISHVSECTYQITIDRTVVLKTVLRNIVVTQVNVLRK